MRNLAIVTALSMALGGCREMWLEADQGPLEGSGPHPKFGFVTEEKESRIWVFRWGSKDLADYRKLKEMAKSVTCPGIGPNGMTVRAPDMGTAYDYVYGASGFHIWPDENGRFWVFRAFAPEQAEFAKTKELAKHVTRPGAGPGGATVKGPDMATIDAFLAATKGK